MKEKILKIILELTEKNFAPEVVSGIVERNNNLGLALDIKELGMSKEAANKLVEEISKKIKLEHPSLNKVTIILTTDKTKGNFEESKKEVEQPQLPKNIASNARGESILPVVGVKKIIAISSAKGGVGKSTIAVNLAISLKRIGYNVALVDADIYGPSIPYLLNINEKPEVKDNLIIPNQNFGLKSISIGSLIDVSSAGVWRGPMVSKILHQLIRGVNWKCDQKDVDIMIIDMPPGTGDIYLSLAEKFPIAGAVIISTPQSLSVIDVVKSIDMFLRLKIKIIGLIQNMSYLEFNQQKQYLFGKDGAKNLAKKLEIDFLADIAIEQEIADYSEKREPISAALPASKIALNFGQIAEKIIDKL